MYWGINCNGLRASLKSVYDSKELLFIAYRMYFDLFQMRTLDLKTCFA